MPSRVRAAWAIEARLDQEGWEWETVEQDGHGRGIRHHTLRPAIRGMERCFARGHGLKTYHNGRPLCFYPYEDRSPVKELRLRIRNVQTGDVLTLEQAQTITAANLPLVPEVLGPFFAANQSHGTQVGLTV